MYRPTDDEIKEILRRHDLWLRDEEGGIRADFSGADLSNIDLRDTNLSDANLMGANLHKANLCRARLVNALLNMADLSEAYLSEANLSKCNLSDANLEGANLSGARLFNANLSKCNLSRSSLSHADLRGAHMKNVDLEGANLTWAFGNGEEILTVSANGYFINITDQQIWIDQEHYLWDEWLKFSDDDISNMKLCSRNMNLWRSGADNLKFWQDWKPELSRIIEERAAQRASIHDDAPSDTVTSSLWLSPIS